MFLCPFCLMPSFVCAVCLCVLISSNSAGFYLFNRICSYVCPVNVSLLSTLHWVRVASDDIFFHQSISFRLSNIRSQWQQAYQGVPRPPSHQQRFPTLPGRPWAAPGPDGIHNPSSQSWAYPREFAQLDVPATPQRRGVPEASWSDARTTSDGFLWCREAGALPWVHPEYLCWQEDRRPLTGGSPFWCFRSPPRGHGRRWGV